MVWIHLCSKSLSEKANRGKNVIEEQFDRNSALESQLPSKINKQIS